MSKEQMPAVEAEIMDDVASEQNSYELAFHILPTIAEEEVLTVYADLKAAITAAGGEVSTEEAPERFDLAYEIEKHYEGKNKKYHTAYFGWVRFKAVPEAAVTISEELGDNVNVLRHLLIKLTRAEENNPFNFHEALKAQKQVSDIEEEEVAPKKKEVAEESKEVEEAKETDEAKKEEKPASEDVESSEEDSKEEVSEEKEV